MLRKYILILNLLLLPLPVFALEYSPLTADDMPVMHILVINSTIVAIYCTVKLLMLFIKRMRD